MIYNHMPDWIYASKNLSSSAKLLMERIFTLSKDGTQHVYIKRSTFAETLGLSDRSLTRCFQELINFGLIEEKKNSNPFDKTKNFFVTRKACSLDLNVSINDDNLSQSIVTKCPNREEQVVTIDETKRHYRHGQNVALDIDKMSLSSSDRNKDRNIFINSAECDKTEEQILGSKKEHNKNSYPQTLQEVEKLFEEHINKWSSEKPELKSINIKYESSLFLEYWTAENWKRKGRAVKSVKGTVATWIDNAVKHTSFKTRQSLNYNKSLTTNFAVNIDKIPTAQVGRFYS